MRSHNDYYYFGLFLIVHVKYFAATKCYDCDGMIFNSSLTIDNIPSPTIAGCELVSAESTCSVRVAWFKDSATEVYYNTDPALPIDSVVVKIERKVTTWSGEYETRRFIIYTCKASNVTPCNTVENLKRALSSTTFPTNEQVEKFDALIVPTTDFDGRLCLKFSNRTDCRETNLASCQQCIGIVQYSNQIETCATCPAGKAITNFFDYETTFFLENQTRSDVIGLGCRRFGGCNSIANIERIKNTLDARFDFNQFYRSTASVTTSTLIVLVMGLLNVLHTTVANF